MSEIAPHPLAGVSDVVELRSTGWSPTRDLTPEEWLAEGRAMTKISRAWQWWLGDWATYGQEFGSLYDDAIATTGLDYQTIANCVWVAGAVDFSRRRENLSWTHHEIVAALPPDEQERWLELAESTGMSTKQLRDAIKASKETPPAEDDEPPADDEAPPVIEDAPPTLRRLPPDVLDAPLVLGEQGWEVEVDGHQVTMRIKVSVAP